MTNVNLHLNLFNYFQFISIRSCTKTPMLSTLCIMGKLEKQRPRYPQKGVRVGDILRHCDNTVKQECIPVGCVPHILYHMGRPPGQKPLDRDPPGQRSAWTETPWTETPWS